MPELALSTMWGIKKFPNLKDFFDAGQLLGFTRFELNHAVDSEMLRGLNLNSHRITSVHEPCPADVSVSQLKERDWLISATVEENRKNGVAAIMRSIDLAHEIGASAIIVHPGRVEIETTLDDEMRKLYRAGKANSPEYAELREQEVAARAARAGANFDAVRRSLIELAEYAAPLKIQLGLENRYHYHEIPLPDELEQLLNLGYDDVIGFWYDVGHAETLDRLGFIPHEDWLRRFATRIIGVHLHDVQGIDDHQAAGNGGVNWNMVARYLPADALRTCEFQNFNSPQQVADGVKWLVEKGCVSA